MIPEVSSDMHGPLVSVVIPTLNESKNLSHVFARMPEPIHEVIIVDGHSTDDTVEVARQLWPDVRIVMQSRKGKGNALACGFAAATGDIIATIDADGSTDPGEIPLFVKELLNGVDFAKGTRFAHGGGSEDITRFRSLGNKVLGWIVNTLYGTSYTDLCYGFNVFWRRHLPVLGLDLPSPSPSGPAPSVNGSSPSVNGSAPSPEQLWGDGFEIETLIHMRVAGAGLMVTEVPSYEHSRLHGASNLSAFKDGLRVLMTIIRENRATRRAYVDVPRADQPASQADAPKDVALSTQEPLDVGAEAT